MGYRKLKTPNDLGIEKFFHKKSPELSDFIKDLSQLLLNICFIFFQDISHLLEILSLKN